MKRPDFSHEKSGAQWKETMRVFVRLVFASAVLGVVLVSCGGATVDELTLEMGDGFFEPEELTVRVGEEVTIEVINPDTREHDLVIVREVFDFEFQANGAVETDPGVVVGRLERIKPGESDSITVTFDAPGEYQFFCGMFHHFAQGAHGIITVES